MKEGFTLEPIAHIQTCFPEKFGIPRQSALVPAAKGQVILHPPFNQIDCFDGLEQASHIWLLFIFHQHIDQPWKPKVRPPRLGGNKKLGVFASRSSFRPNYLGQSVVALESVREEGGGVILEVAGVDLVDGTPIVDIKPYVPYADSVQGARFSYAEEPPEAIAVNFSLAAENFCCQGENGASLRQLVVQVLQQNPRPAYHRGDMSQRIYKMSLLDFTVCWLYREADSNASIDVTEIVSSVNQ